MYRFPRCFPPLSTLMGSRAAILAVAICAGGTASADQPGMVPHTAMEGPVLTFDWPAVQVGIGSYEEGPTGLTIFRFPERVSAVVDVRGGAPGTVNTDILRLGYGAKVVDAIVIAGGSDYGEEAITAVMTGLKDEGERSGDKIALAAGAIIYDFHGHRLNEFYPDKALAQATLRALRPGVFPLGAQGAGRMAMQGSLLGCGAHSGEGGAFRQIGATKIAAFTVVNAGGTVVDRDGRIVRCHADPAWKGETKVSALLSRLDEAAEASATAPTGHTTISVVVTNRKMGPADLQRLAVQVHTSMARAIQPFSTYGDGDTLFAVSTQEVGDTDARPRFGAIDLIAGEVMWDAILASVPEDVASNSTATSNEAEIKLSPVQLGNLVGSYRMGPHATVDVSVSDGDLIAKLHGAPFGDLGVAPVVAHASSPTDFHIGGRYDTTLSFQLGSDGTASGLTINPGRWAQLGTRMPKP